ncbi:MULTISPECIES: electron transfer flavoprotein [unclassified Adlercreutzia]|uniref:electron transfer flavoprotein n=1 Tax=unclassified Adlercreutzia TaxID=2636013 RepID=UPI0013E9E464|nr:MULTISPECIES: electron transfer flavoprotein [unclassified Adlercreutzia]
MNTVACYKVVADAQDIVANDDRTLRFDKASYVLGEYDLNAIEEAVRVASDTQGRAVLLSAGDARLSDSKLRKAALSRGATEQFCVVDEGMARADALQTAAVLAAALQRIGFDLAFFGEGSADAYGQQTGALVGALLDVTVVNAVSAVRVDGGAVVVERSLEGEVEVLELAAPAVISVTSDANLPRIPQLKDILAAGKKPSTTWTVDELGAACAPCVEVASMLAPQSVARKQVIYEGDVDEAVRSLAADIKAAK